MELSWCAPSSIAQTAQSVLSDLRITVVAHPQGPELEFTGVLRTDTAPMTAAGASIQE